MPREPKPGRRIEVLDVLRGIAIIGTLGTNIWIFAHPLGPAGFFELLDGAGLVERVAQAVTNGKLLALLTLLFGVGLELQYRSAVRRGLRWPGRYLWRATLLFVEGLLHYVLVFEFDVLMGYALVSMLVAYLVGRSERVIRRWLVGSATVTLALVAVTTAALVLAPESAVAGSGEPTRLFANGTWWEQVLFRVEQWATFRAEFIFIVPLGTALFPGGICLLRAGVFDPGEAGQRLRNHLMILGAGVGVPLNILSVLAGPNWFFVERYVAAPLIALGLLGFIPTVLQRMRPTLRPTLGALRRGVTAVGRTALSCYVFQNVAASALCYGWGLGLATRLDWARPWFVFALWALITAGSMLLSAKWLRHFDRGPLETLWQWAYQLRPRPRERTQTPGS